VVLIASLGLGAAIKLARVEFHERREKEIVTSFENINELLLSYYTGVDDTGNDIKRLPCPALPNLSIDDPDFGQEDCANATIVEGNVPHPDDATRNLRIMIGAIPAQELSMANEEAFDVFGGQLLYAVSEDLTIDINFLRNDMSAIQRQNNNGTFSGLPLPYMFLSMGDTNIGAYGIDGNIIELCPDIAVSREGENCDRTDGVFLDAFITEESGAVGFF